MKKATIRFYTDTNKYMGWQYLHKSNLLELRSWTNSGNNIVIHGVIFNSKDIAKIKEIQNYIN